MLETTSLAENETSVQWWDTVLTPPRQEWPRGSLRDSLRWDIADSYPALSFALLSFCYLQQAGGSSYQKLRKCAGGEHG